MLQHEKPDDFVIATGNTWSIREFAEMAFENVNIKIEWEGKNEKEVGKNKSSGETVIKIDPRYYRPSEVDVLKGDATKALKVLGWKPKTSLKKLVKIMVDYDLKYDDYGGED